MRRYHVPLGEVAQRQAQLDRVAAAAAADAAADAVARRRPGPVPSPLVKRVEHRVAEIVLEGNDFLNTVENGYCDYHLMVMIFLPVEN